MADVGAAVGADLAEAFAAIFWGLGLLQLSSEYR